MNARTIPLTRGKVALVDERDYELVAGKQWFASPVANTCSARRKPGGYMHRLILHAPPDMEVDHVNGDGLDNRRSNLRLATHRQNGCNRPKRHGLSSRYKGVFWSGCVGKWCAQIKDRKSLHLGCFSDEIDAALAYDVAALSLWGDFAHLNFLRSGNGSL